jgi:hypothetical protein
MKSAIHIILAAITLGAPAKAASVLFDFNNAPVHTPITAAFPLDLTVGGIAAHFSATGEGYSIQDTAQVVGVLPTGFSGLGISPSSVFAADLLVSFPQEVVTDFSIMVAPQELTTDSTATLRVTAFLNGVLVGTHTSMGSEPFLWPSSTLSFSSASGFNSVVVHYDSPPPTGGDYGSIFVADNMTVTATSVPEPGSLVLLGIGILGLCFWLGYSQRRANGQHCLSE